MIYKPLQQHTVPAFTIVVVHMVGRWNCNRDMSAILSSSTHWWANFPLKSSNDGLDFRKRCWSFDTLLQSASHLPEDATYSALYNYKQVGHIIEFNIACKLVQSDCQSFLRRNYGFHHSSSGLHAGDAGHKGFAMLIVAFWNYGTTHYQNFVGWKKIPKTYFSTTLVHLL